MLAINGKLAAAAPAPPTTVVSLSKKSRRPVSSNSSYSAIAFSTSQNQRILPFANAPAHFTLNQFVRHNPLASIFMRNIFERYLGNTLQILIYINIKSVM